MEDGFDGQEYELLQFQWVTPDPHDWFDAALAATIAAVAAELAAVWQATLRQCAQPKSTTVPINPNMTVRESVVKMTACPLSERLHPGIVRR